MTGMERNSDVVCMAAYAPLFVNIHHRRWNPNLINFDSAKVYGIPSYYVQQLFSAHTGSATVPVEVTCSNTEGESIAGQVGVGTWSTQAEFKDIVVTGIDGKVLYSSDFNANAKKGWKFPTGGDWTTADGALRQTSNTNGARAVVGDPQWKNYTLTLKARKLSGHEGFLILFGMQGRATNKSWWNIGGWGNKRHALEAGGIDDASVDGSIETGRWYDIKVEVKGGSVRCSLDGKVIHDVKTPAMKALYASATITKDNDEVIVKAVNVDMNPAAVEIVLDGVTKVNSKAKAWVLTSDDPMAENTIENLTKVVPIETTLRISGNALTHTLPGNSLTVLRFGIKK
jgi:alpha-L-arabinofuranosidase